MSVFIVNQYHINAMVNTLRRLNREGIWVNELYFDPYCAQDMQALGQIFLDENYSSYCHRYSEELSPEKFVYQRDTKLFAPVAILKAAHCYEYQTCESPTWEDSDAKTALEMLRTGCIRRLEGYEEAAWEIQQPLLVHAE